MPLNPPPTDPMNHTGAGLPQWKRADCLGCDSRIVRARDAWVEIGGTRSGSYLVTWGAEPLLAHATDPDRLPDEPTFLLGVAHRSCLETVHTRAEAGSLRVAADLPLLKVELGEGLPALDYALHLPAQPESCPFCDRTEDLTNEHVWPEWFSRELRRRGASLTGDNVRRGRIDLTVPVCGACNNTWMSVLENDAAHVLRKMMGAGAQVVEASRFAPHERARLASWAVLKAYLLDSLAQQPIVPRGFLQEFALRREPNESTIVWVAGYTPDVAARAEERALDFPGRDGRGHNSPNGFAVTFTAFNVLFQVVGHFNKGSAVMHDRRWQYEPALFRVWPAPTNELEWPPAVGFSGASWNDLVASVSDDSGA